MERWNEDRLLPQLESKWHRKHNTKRVSRKMEACLGSLRRSVSFDPSQCCRQEALFRLTKNQQHETKQRSKPDHDIGDEAAARTIAGCDEKRWLAKQSVLTTLSICCVTWSQYSNKSEAEACSTETPVHIIGPHALSWFGVANTLSTLDIWGRARDPRTFLNWRNKREIHKENEYQ